MTIRRTAPLMVAALVFASAPSMAAAASKTPPSIKVSSTRIVKKDGVTCAFVPSPTSKKARSDWRPGVRVGKTRFTSHEAAKVFYKKLGGAYRKKYGKAAADQAVGARVCNRMSPFTFRTSGIVGFALAESKSTTKKGVRATATGSDPVGGLYGIEEDGDIATIIAPIEPKEKSFTTVTKIEKLYPSADGTVHVRYSAHPDDCRVGKIPAGSTMETCVVAKSDLPAGFEIGDGGGYAAETTEVMQFDSVGNLYLNLRGLSTECRPAGATSFTNTEMLMRVAVDGTVSFAENSQCTGTLYSWAPLKSAGAIYTWHPNRRDVVNNRTSLRVWRDGAVTVLKEDLDTTWDGIHTLPNGRTLINVFQAGADVFPGNSTEQGGILRYDEATGVLSTWYHYASESPAYSVENVVAPVCDCRGLLLQPIASAGQRIFGVGYLYSQTVPSTGPPTSWKRLFRLSPSVTASIAIPDSLRPTSLLAVSDRYAALAGPDYLSCLLPGQKGYDCTSFTLGLIDTETGASKTLVTSSDQLAVVTLAASTESKRFVAQAVRLTDKKYMIGIIDGASKTVKWQETGSLKFRWVGTFK